MNILGLLLLLGCCLPAIVLTSDSFEKLGVLIRFEKGNKEELKAYISHLTSPVCEAILEFNVVVTHNAQAQFEQVKSQLQALEAAIPIHHYVSTQQEDQLKFKIAKGSQAELYYISSLFINDEACQDIEDYLKLGNARTVSGVLGVVGEEESSTTIQVDLTRKEKEIFYYDKIQGNHYSMVEDIRLIPRHFLELAGSNIPQVKEIMKLTNFYCEELIFNFLGAHFYPELRPLAFNFPTSINVQLQEMEEFQQKCTCIRKLINILGYVPVFNQRKGFKNNIWVNPSLGKVIELKKQQLIMKISQAKEQGADRLLGTLVEDKTTEETLNVNDSQQLFLRILVGAILTISILIVAIEYKDKQKG